MKARALVVALVLAVTSACSPPQWTADDHAAVTLACLTSASIAADVSLGEMLASDQGEELQALCADYAADLEVFGCDPDEAAEIAQGIALLGSELTEAREQEC